MRSISLIPQGKVCLYNQASPRSLEPIFKSKVAQFRGILDENLDGRGDVFCLSCNLYVAQASWLHVRSPVCFIYAYTVWGVRLLTCHGAF